MNLLFCRPQKTMRLKVASVKSRARITDNSCQWLVVGQYEFRWCLSLKFPPWVESGPLVIGRTDNATRRSCPTSLPSNVGLSYCEEPGEGVFVAWLSSCMD